MNRKPVIVLLFIIMILLTACSSGEGNTLLDERSEKDGQETEVSAEVKQSLNDFQQEVRALIEEYDEDFQEFSDAVKSKSEEFSEEDLQALKEQAAQSSEELAAELENLEIPDELEAYSEELNETIDELIADLNDRSEYLSAEEVAQAFDKAQAVSEDLINEFEQGLGSLYESLGIDKPDFLTDNE